MPHPVLARINALVEPFFSREFGVAEAMRLGEAARNGHGDRTVLRPRDVKGAFLLLGREDPDGETGYLTSLEFVWPASLRLRRTDLIETFGPFKVWKALQAVLPDTWMFPVRGRPHLGQVLVTVAPAAGDHVDVTSLALRRFPPEPYRPDRGRAVRILVLADLGATELRPDPWPEPAWIWKEADIDALILRLRPAIRLQVADRLGITAAGNLDLTFRPDAIAAFHPNALVRRLEPLASLIQLGDGLLDLVRKRIGAERLRKSLETMDLPPRYRKDAEAVLAARPVRPAALLHAIDTALSAQVETLLADPGFRHFQAAWLGLQYLAENLDTADGSRIEVHATPRDAQAATLVEGILEEELNHPEGAPPALLVVDGEFSATASDLGHLGALASEAARIGTPVVFGVSPSPGNFEPSAWARLASHPQAKLLIGVYPRVRLRADPASDSNMLRCFRYAPSGPGRPDLDVWGGGAWALAAAVARGLVEGHHPGDASAGAPRPPLLETWREPADPIETPPGPGRAGGGNAPPLTILSHDPEDGRIAPAGGLRSLAPQTERVEPPETLILRATIAGMLRRLESRTPRRVGPAEVRTLILEAIEARLPGAQTSLEMETSPGWPKPLRLRISLPGSTGDAVSLEIDRVWKAPRN